jgi:plastocyanin
MNRTRFSAGLICFVLLFAACGGSDEPEASEQETESQEEQAGSETKAEVAEDDKACLEGPHEGMKVKVTGDDFFFKPKKIEAEPGDVVTVVFRNVGRTPHSFTLDEPACDTDPIFGDEGPVEATFVAPDQNAKFICTVHPNMTGELLVQ